MAQAPAPSPAPLQAPSNRNDDNKNNQENKPEINDNKENDIDNKENKEEEYNSLDIKEFVRYGGELIDGYNVDDIPTDVPDIVIKLSELKYKGNQFKSVRRIYQDMGNTRLPNEETGWNIWCMSNTGNWNFETIRHYGNVVTQDGGDVPVYRVSTFVNFL